MDQARDNGVVRRAGILVPRVCRRKGNAFWVAQNVPRFARIVGALRRCRWRLAGASPSRPCMSHA